MTKKSSKYLKMSTGVDMHEKVIHYYKFMEKTSDIIDLYKVISIGFINVEITSTFIKKTAFKGKPSTKKEFNKALKSVKEQLKQIKNA